MAHDEPDPDVVRWGLQDLKVCALSNEGCCSSVTRYQDGSVTHGCVREDYNEPVTTGHVENDLVIAQLYQEELSKVAQAEAAGILSPSRSSVITQEWNHQKGQEIQGRGTDDPGKVGIDDNMSEMKIRKDLKTVGQEGENSPTRDVSLMGSDDSMHFIEIEEGSSSLDGEVGKRLNHMVPVPHVPKINGELPSEDEQISDHERLLQRLRLYDLVENKVKGDGNCQFRSLSDQLYRSPECHKFVREQVVHQLVSHRKMYEGYVSMGYDDYLKKMRRNGEWGDHVTLQAAADWFGVRIFVITSFKDTCYIEILPHIQKSNRLICLSFWAEVHYNSIYPEGELPIKDSKKTKKWWPL